MTQLFHDGPFWVFMTTLVGAIRWLVKVIYVYKMKHTIFKNQMEMKVVDTLKKVVEDIKPMIERHEASIGKLEVSIQNMAVIYSNMTEMMASLQKNYEAFESRMSKVSEGANIVMDRVRAMETEIINFKNGNIFIRTKK